MNTGDRVRLKGHPKTYRVVRVYTVNLSEWSSDRAEEYAQLIDDHGHPATWKTQQLESI